MLSLPNHPATAPYETSTITRIGSQFDTEQAHHWRARL